MALQYRVVWRDDKDVGIVGGGEWQHEEEFYNSLEELYMLRKLENLMEQHGIDLQDGQEGVENENT